jgi:predicted RNA-binding protein YlxR (DUF448 family)
MTLEAAPAAGRSGGGHEAKEPTRTCVGCGKKQSKWLLHRVVLSTENHPAIDKAHVAPGRGAYLCGPGCLKAAVKKKAFQRAFKRSVELDVTTLEADLQNAR